MLTSLLRNALSGRRGYRHIPSVPGQTYATVVFGEGRVCKGANVGVCQSQVQQWWWAVSLFVVAHFRFTACWQSGNLHYTVAMVVCWKSCIIGLAESASFLYMHIVYHIFLLVVMPFRHKYCAWRLITLGHVSVAKASALDFNIRLDFYVNG